jgi:hypothetical protein
VVSDADRRGSPSVATTPSGVRAGNPTAVTGSTNMSELSDVTILTLLGLALLAALLAALSAWRNRRALDAARAESATLQREMQLLQQSVSALTAGALGLDRRLDRLAAREQVLAERQETYEIQQADEQPYSHAIRLVQQGASVNRLVEELELSESEASLIVRLHGQRDSA